MYIYIYICIYTVFFFESFPMIQIRYILCLAQRPPVGCCLVITWSRLFGGSEGCNCRCVMWKKGRVMLIFHWKKDVFFMVLNHVLLLSSEFREFWKVKEDLGCWSDSSTSHQTSSWQVTSDQFLPKKHQVNDGQRRCKMIWWGYWTIMEYQDISYHHMVLLLCNDPTVCSQVVGRMSFGPFAKGVVADTWRRRATAVVESPLGPQRVKNGRLMSPSATSPPMVVIMQRCFLTVVRGSAQFESIRESSKEPAASWQPLRVHFCPSFWYWRLLEYAIRWTWIRFINLQSWGILRTDMECRVW